jgi:hypothetical protein
MDRGEQNLRRPQRNLTFIVVVIAALSIMPFIIV